MLKKKRVRLGVERLEDRCVPTGATYHWTGAIDNVWEKGGNWQESRNANDYPGHNGMGPTTNDIAILDGTNSSSTKPCAMGSGHTLSAIHVNGTYASTLTLNALLTLDTG